MLFDGFEILTFRFSRTQPELPHEYSRRDRDNPAASAAHIRLFERILAQGVREYSPVRPGKKRYRNTYWYAGDGYKYWAMTTNVDFSLIINRTLIDIYDTDNNPLPDPMERAIRAAALIKDWPSLERQAVTLAQALALGSGR
jgi:hypothetical protein